MKPTKDRISISYSKKIEQTDRTDNKISKINQNCLISKEDLDQSREIQIETNPIIINSRVVKNKV